MAMPARARRSAPLGHATPRIAPPRPLRSDVEAFREFAASVGISLYPWQVTAAQYLTALGPHDRWLFREVAIIVARQNGKTTLLVPLIIQRLLAGQAVMHTAQNAKLPREVHEQVATLLQEHYPEVLPRKRAISYAVGHEEIRLVKGGKYRIVAPTKGGARGPANDLVIVDELREMEDHGFIGAAKPTLTASKKPQMVYLSNAGTDDSEVLNAIRSRADQDPVLAYLEWSAAPDRSADDVRGWEESNPTLGHDPAILETLTTEHRTHSLAGTLAIFETEHLCRWVPTLRELLVNEYDWINCKVDALGKPVRAGVGVALAPEGNRASIALAWQAGNRIAVRLLEHVTAEQIDVDAVGELVRTHANRYGAKVAYDPLTDGELVKYVAKPKAESVTGSKYAAASANFALAVSSQRIAWHEADAVTDDLTWTARKPDGTEGSYHAVRAKDDRPITASLAAIRAVWLASGPPPAKPRIY